jgi:predicted RNase H-like HicB family nuclease
MKKLKYVVYKEGKYFISQCLNVDVSSFGTTIEEDTGNLKEALALYFEDNVAAEQYLNIRETLIGEFTFKVS